MMRSQAPTTRHVIVAALLSFSLVLGLGCRGGCSGGSSGAASEPPSPEALVARIALPKGTSLGWAGKRLEAMGQGSEFMVGMGISSMVTAAAGELVKNPSALTLSSPMHLFAVYEEGAKLMGGDGPEVAFALAGSFTADPDPISDAVGFKSLGGTTLVAPKAHLEALEAFAKELGAPDEEQGPMARLYPQKFEAAFRGPISDIRKEFESVSELSGGGIDLTAILGLYAKMGRAMVEGAEWVEISIGKEDDSLFRTITQAKAGSDLAGFMAMQEAHDFELSDRLPNSTSGTMYFEGTLKMGEYMDAMFEMTKSFLPAGMWEAYEGGMKELADAMTGSFAGAMTFGGDDGLMGMAMGGGFNYSATFIATTTKSTDGAIRQMWKDVQGNEPMKMMGVEQTATYRADTRKVGGRGVHTVDMVSQIPMGAGGDTMEMRQKMEYLATDDLLLVAQAVGTDTKVEPLYERAVESKGDALKLSEGIQGAVDRAEKNKESMVMAFDLSGLIPPGTPIQFTTMAMSFGVRGGDSDSPQMVMGLDLR